MSKNVPEYEVWKWERIAALLKCPLPGCGTWFKSWSARVEHLINEHGWR